MNNSEQIAAKALKTKTTKLNMENMAIHSENTELKQDNVELKQENSIAFSCANFLTSSVRW